MSYIVNLFSKTNNYYVLLHKNHLKLYSIFQSAIVTCST